MPTTHAKIIANKRALDLADVLRIIHRHGDGVITFHRMPGGKFENLFGIRARHLKSLLAPVLGRLTHDAYFSLNAYWSGDRGKHHHPANRVRNRERLRYLCTCFCDLDCYNANLSPAEVLPKIVALEKNGIIPPISGFANSGRGIWLFWLLHDRDDPRRAQRAFEEKIDLYDLIQDELHRRLTQFAADAKDACRVARVPESVNSKSGRRVHYHFKRGRNGSVVSYTLQDLATQLGLSPRPHTKFTVSRQRSVPKRRKGYEALAARRLRDFEQLWKMRQGFGEGERNYAAMIYAWLLRCNGIGAVGARPLVLKLAKECRPPLSIAECRGALKTGFNPKMRKLRDTTIADWLRIIPDESARLEKLPPCSRFCSAITIPVKASQRGARTQHRRALIQDILQQMTSVPSSREMARLLKQRGCEVSHVCVAADYKDLHVRTAPS